jgi:hypothetical protein
MRISCAGTGIRLSWEPDGDVDWPGSWVNVLQIMRARRVRIVFMRFTHFYKGLESSGTRIIVKI